MMNRVEFHGHADCVRLSNDTLDIVAATTFGPRLLRCGFLDGPNLLGEHPHLATKTAIGTWRPHGGHRVWASPEEMPGSYAPDDRPVRWEATDDQISLRQDTDASGLAKAMVVRLPASGGTLTIDHELRNEGFWPIEIAVWPLTIMAPGGVAVLPQHVFDRHADKLRPARVIAMWPFTDLSDRRWFLGRQLITMTPDRSKLEPQKLGIRNERGWCACVWPHAVLIKHLPYEADGVYPDGGVNNEVYAEGDFLELETLGCLQRLEPGESGVHQEQWSVFPGLDASVTSDEATFHEALTELAATVEWEMGSS